MNRILVTMLCVITGLVLMAAKGCSITAETDRAEYQVGDQGLSTLFNELGETAYLGGCAAFNYEQLEKGRWVNKGPNVICVWEGTVRPLPTSEIFVTDFVAGEPGIFRHRYDVGFGCTEGVPMSSANCSDFQPVYTGQYEVQEVAATCDYYGKTFKEGDTFLDFDLCSTCRCEAGGAIACPEKDCQCTGDEWFRDYRGNAAECGRIDFVCPSNQFDFGNPCGCGCQQAPWCEPTYDCESPTDCSFEQTHCPYSLFAL